MFGHGSTALDLVGAGDDELGATLHRWLDSVIPAPWTASVAAGSADDLLGAAGEEAYSSWYHRLADTGVVVPRWPSRAGGLGLDPNRSALVEQILAARGIVRSGAFELARIGPAIAEWGTQEQLEAYLPGILLGRVQWCQLFSEPGAGSDLPSLSTTAVRDGSRWKVRGQKVWTSAADTARFGLLLARTNPDRPKRQGLTCFLVDMRLSGVVIRPLRQLTGDESFSEVFLDNLMLEDELRLGPEHGGWAIARTVLSGERRGISGAGAGERMAFDASVDVALLKGCKRPEDAARLYMIARVHEWRNERLRDATEPGWASLSKIAQSDLNQLAHEHALMELGIRGAACESTDVASLEKRYAFLRSRANTIEGGTSEIHRNTVAEQLLGLPREPDHYHGAPWNRVPR